MKRVFLFANLLFAMTATTACDFSNSLLPEQMGIALDAKLTAEEQMFVDFKTAFDKKTAADPIPFLRQVLGAVLKEDLVEVAAGLATEYKEEISNALQLHINMMDPIGESKILVHIIKKLSIEKKVVSPGKISEFYRCLGGLKNPAEATPEVLAKTARECAQRALGTSIGWKIFRLILENELDAHRARKSKPNDEL